MSIAAQRGAAAGTSLPRGLGVRHLINSGSWARDAHRISHGVARASETLGVETLMLRYGTPDAGEARLVQLARVFATGATFLLFDEPAAGMTREERSSLATTLLSLAALGHGILLVEHDLGLISEVADTVTVMSQGGVLASGSTEQVRNDPAVVAAYIGGTALT